MPSELPKEKQTALGLYVTAHEAYERWQAAPATVKVLDVRTPAPSRRSTRKIVVGMTPDRGTRSETTKDKEKRR